MAAPTGQCKFCLFTTQGLFFKDIDCTIRLRDHKTPPTHVHARRFQRAAIHTFACVGRTALGVPLVQNRRRSCGARSAVEDGEITRALEATEMTGIRHRARGTFCLARDGRLRWTRQPIRGHLRAMRRRLRVVATRHRIVVVMNVPKMAASPDRATRPNSRAWTDHAGCGARSGAVPAGDPPCCCAATGQTTVRRDRQICSLPRFAADQRWSIGCHVYPTRSRL